MKDSNGIDQSNLARDHPDSGLLFVTEDEEDEEDEEAGAARRTGAGFQTAFEKVDRKYVVRSAAQKTGVGRRWVPV